ncbi:MAG: hypothetical protein C0514_00100 [Candidatus Puniceispirillum sp.]|nr:hypothetical protein [Candidatus Puniceispirillum sp.]
MKGVTTKTLFFLLICSPAPWEASHASFEGEDPFFDTIAFTKAAIVSALEDPSTVCINDTDYDVTVPVAPADSYALWSRLPPDTSLTFHMYGPKIWTYVYSLSGPDKRLLIRLLPRHT